MSIFNKLSAAIHRISAGNELPGREKENPPESREKSGVSNGEFVAEGIGDDELIAVILAAVCEYTEIPMGQIKITSIKAL